jgi:hypothetical protein
MRAIIENSISERDDAHKGVDIMHRDRESEQARNDGKEAEMQVQARAREQGRKNIKKLSIKLLGRVVRL